MNFVNWWKVHDYDQKLHDFGFDYMTKSGWDADGGLIYELKLENGTKFRLEISFDTSSDKKEEHLFEIVVYYLNFSADATDIDDFTVDVFKKQGSSFDDLFNELTKFLTEA